MQEEYPSTCAGQEELVLVQEDALLHAHEEAFVLYKRIFFLNKETISSCAIKSCFFLCREKMCRYMMLNCPRIGLNFPVEVPMNYTQNHVGLRVQPCINHAARLAHANRTHAHTRTHCCRHEHKPVDAQMNP